MIDIGILVDFYFTKYLFMGMAILGIMKCIKRLVLGRNSD